MDKTENAIELTDLRLACKQFAMLYFHFCKTLKDAFGADKALPIAQKAVFEFGLDRTDRARERAAALGIETNVENFPQANDLPSIAWTGWKQEMGGVRCPYAEVWLGYFEANAWFKPFASMYCDVIDTTNIENFTRTTSQKITKNLLWGDDCCEREYFESAAAKEGKYSYGERAGSLEI
ncbi:MAG: L-2-amino-thiazoline-4-carboxylic acid hydrolase [Spirochaetes bacterium]|nr:L-2-amino-thiazoline-4-carboxylic acid hydrolase [Spirochaetota bacterium]